MLDDADLSDWENGSRASGRLSANSQFKARNKLKVKGLETIYLQRLEPSVPLRKGGPASVKRGDDKPKFRVMHHKYHDEPEWHIDADPERDELESVISNNYNQMLRQEFQGKNEKFRKVPKRKKSSQDDVQFKAPNLFTGNFNQYKERLQKSNAPSVDFNK